MTFETNVKQETYVGFHALGILFKRTQIERFLVFLADGESLKGSTASKA